MVEQFSGIGQLGPAGVGKAAPSSTGGAQDAAGKSFKDLLMDSINEVNRLQSEADEARINLMTGQTENVAEVFTAVKKAELAFQTLMQIRNKLMEAYDEIKQMRV